ncbi:family 78 glycoside hydrolase catalytic domain [Streptomyces sp. M10(2022)]
MGLGPGGFAQLHRCRVRGPRSQPTTPTPGRYGPGTSRVRRPLVGPASFDVGLLAPSDWSAWWLQVDDGALVRRNIDVKKPVARARLYFAAQGIVEPHLNGKRVKPAQVLDSSVTDYDTRVLYRALDVTKQLRKGSNALAFMAGKGQFSGRPAFVAQLDVTYTDGSVGAFGTDTAWKSAAGPVTGEDFYYGETYDARKAIPGWDTAGFDDSAWATAHPVAPASHRLSLAQGKPVDALDSTDSSGWSPAALTDGTDGSTDTSQGYHSAIAPAADTTKWVQTDLGAGRHIRRIRLFPARPTNDPAGDLVGAGFPVRYRVQVSDDPAFDDTTTTTVVDRTGADQAGPGTAPVSLKTDARGRYVRVTATKLACVEVSCTFRLAELGVYGSQPAMGYDAITRPEADTTPPTRVVSTLAPVEETRPSAGRRVLDFGQNYSGWVTIRATASAGTTVHIKKGEILDASGHVSTSNISFSDADPPRQTDHYTFSGSGTETYARTSPTPASGTPSSPACRTAPRSPSPRRSSTPTSRRRDGSAHRTRHSTGSRTRSRGPAQQPPVHAAGLPDQGEARLAR